MTTKLYTHAKAQDRRKTGGSFLGEGVFLHSGDGEGPYGLYTWPEIVECVSHYAPIVEADQARGVIIFDTIDSEDLAVRSTVSAYELESDVETYVRDREEKRASGHYPL